jgi:hypothetical protein
MNDYIIYLFKTNRIKKYIYHVMETAKLINI